MTRETITVFGSGHPRPGDPDYELARQLGAELARCGFAVCTGGYGGVMEAALRGAKETGGRTLAITTRAFQGKANARPNAWTDEERVMDSWQARLFELIRASQGYVACKGGTGTLAELAVIWEMLNKGVMAGKPMVALGDFWKPVVGCVVAGEAGHTVANPGAHSEAHPEARSERSNAAISNLIQFAPDAREAAEQLTRALDGLAQGGAHGTSL